MVKEVRSFPGFVGYYRCFVENFAKVAALLHELLRGQTGQEKRSSSLVCWLEEQQCSFKQLKVLLIEAPLIMRSRSGFIQMQVIEDLVQYCPKCRMDKRG